jgi:hypothetical protein
VEIREYYAIAAASPEISLKVAALARERIGGMQGIAAEAPKPRVTMVGHRWDNACGQCATSHVTRSPMIDDVDSIRRRAGPQRPADKTALC